MAEPLAVRICKHGPHAVNNVLELARPKPATR
jgi:hypothetical protein